MRYKKLELIWALIGKGIVFQFRIGEVHSVLPVLHEGKDRELVCVGIFF